MNETPAKRTHRKFDEAFKREAVQNWLSSGKSADAIAGDLGLNSNLLYAWRKSFAPADAGGESGGRSEAGHAGGSLGAHRRRPARNPPSARAARHFKKNAGHSLRTAAERYAWIDTMKETHSLEALCELLDVSKSGYYDWLRRRSQPGPRARANAELAKSIAEIHARSRQTYGSPRIVMELRKQKQRHGRNRIARLMKAAGLCGRQQGRYRVQTTDSKHDQPIAPNRLAEAPTASAPNQIWVADITYIRIGPRWLYLAAVLDLYSRKIVGWAMSERIDTLLILKALAMALLHRQPPKDLLFHSDRGVQYASAEYRAALAQAGLIPSMSRKGNCYDNAYIESFWSTLKLEMIYRREFATRREAEAAIFDYIEIFYNRQRAHSALGCLSPVDFETQKN